MENINYEQDFFSAARTGFQSLTKSEQKSIQNYIEESIAEDGSFNNLENKSDLYKSSFGIALLNIFESSTKKDEVSKYLRKFKDGEALNFLYVSALSRSWRFNRSDSLDIGSYSSIAEKLEYNRCSDGLWNQAAGTAFGSVYGTYLAVLAYQNLSQTIPDEGKISKGLSALTSDDMAFGTDRGAKNGSTPATAMATLLLDYMEDPTDFYVSWLIKQQHSDGGFLAVSQMPFSDVQSTVYVIQALKYAAPDELIKIKESVKSFLLSMKKENGFTGHCKDTFTDIENTYFALAGLGMIA